MTWFKLDDKGAFHRKTVAAGNEAYGAWCRAGQWCSEQLSDGRIPVQVALTIGPRRLWERLLEVGLLERLDADTYVIHDFLDWNPSAESVKAERDRKARNVRDYRKKRQGDAGAVTGDVTGYTSGTLPISSGTCNRGEITARPDPDPDPRGNQKRRAETETSQAAGAPAGAALDPPELASIQDRLAAHQVFAAVLHVGEVLHGDWISRGGSPVLLERGLEAIDDCAKKAFGLGLTAPALQSKLVSFWDTAMKRRTTPTLASTAPVESAIDRGNREQRRIEAAEAAARARAT